MPIASSDLKLYGCANMPDDDTSTWGGAIATTKKPVFTPFSAAARPEADSDNAGDTMNLTIEGRNAAGSVISEQNALNGTTAVLWTATYERILLATLASAATGTVTVAEGTGGTVRLTFEPGITQIMAMFRKAASSASAETRYEKVFFKNEHGTLTLTAAQVRLTADPASKIEIGVHTAKGDSATITNRKTAPAGITFVDDNVAQNVPTNELAAGEDIGVWIKQSLDADNAPVHSTFTVQISGQTT